MHCIYIKHWTTPWGKMFKCKTLHTDCCIHFRTGDGKNKFAIRFWHDSSSCNPQGPNKVVKGEVLSAKWRFETGPQLVRGVFEDISGQGHFFLRQICILCVRSMTNIFLCTLNLICQAGVWANIHFHSTLYSSFFYQCQNVSSRMNTENPKSDRMGSLSRFHS